MIYQNVAKPLE